MGLPVGTVIQATYKGTLLGQTVLSVYHYAVLQVSSETDYTNEMNAFLNVFGQQTSGGLLFNYLGCVPTNYTCTSVIAQAIRPTRRLRVVQSRNLTGSRADSSLPNTASAITYRTDFAGRKFVGRKSLPLAPDDVLNGLLIAGIRDALDIYATQTLDNVVGSAGGGIYQHVLLHGGDTPTAPDPIKGFEVQATSRVMRRRTVGLGI